MQKNIAEITICIPSTILLISYYFEVVFYGLDLMSTSSMC